MKKSTMFSMTILCASLFLSGCASGFHEKKAPCPPIAGIFSNPCNPLPINIATFPLNTFLEKELG